MEAVIKQFNEYLANMERYALIECKNVLTFEEAVMYTGYSKGQLYRLTSEKQIPHSKRGKRVFFDKAELDRWLLKDRVPTVDEVSSQAATYIATHKSNASVGKQ